MIIPSIYVKEENLSSNETEISLVFPINNIEKKHFPIYCCLPIQETEFNFIINAYWCLITNRDSIKESSGYNIFLRNEIANFYVKIINKDVYFQKEGIFKYLPRKSDLLSEWWGRFVDMIKTDMEPKVKELVGENKTFKKRLPNKDIMDLLRIDVLNSLSIEIVNPEQHNLTTTDLENFGIETLAITDLLECYQNDKLTDQYKNWYVNCDSEWWNKFFKLLYETRQNNSDMCDLVKNCDIFLHRRRLNSNQKESSRKRLSQNAKYFTCNKKDLYMWRDVIEILDYNSEYERKYLTEVLEIEEITIKHLIDYLIVWHFTLKQDIQLKIDVWYDLDFLKSNYKDEHLTEAINDSVLLDVISVPVKSNGKITSVPIKYAFLTSILSIDTLPIIPNDKIHPIDFNSLVSFLQDQDKYSFNEIISWEYFLLQIGCLQPMVDLKRVQLLEERKELPLLKQFTEYSENDVAILEATLKKQNENNIISLQHLPISACYLNTNKNVSVANTCIKSLYDNYLPSVEIPKYAVALAQRLGVTTELNFTYCIKVLNNFFNENIKDENIYKEWITKLELYINHVQPSELEDNKHTKIICLEDIEGKQRFFSISEIYCCDETVVIKEICKQLNKTFIDFKHNKTFKSIEPTLIRLGCLTKPNFDDLLSLFGNLAFDDSVFAIKSITSMLSCDGYDLFKGMYEVFEELLKSIENDEEEQDSLYYSNLFRMNFQLISYDRRLSAFNSQNVFICYESAFINEFINSVPPNSVFFDTDLAKKCPLTMKFLRARNFSDFTVTYLKHENNNIEHTNSDLNKIIREISKVENFEVLRVAYLNIKVAYLEGFYEPLRSKDIENKDLSIKDKIVSNDIPYAIFNKKWLVWSYRKNTNSEDILIEALRHFLKIVYPDKNIDDFLLDYNNSYLKVPKLIKDAKLWKPCEHASKDPTPFNTNDVVFADSTINCIEAHDAPTNKERKKNYTHISYQNAELCFTERIKQTASELNQIEVNSISRRPEQDQKLNTQDYMELKRIGDRAEHFFCCYLKYHYSESFNEYTDWVSSARLNVYKSGSETSDRLGYDFVVTDYKGLFCSKQSKSDINFKTCFIEVKGCKHEWDGSFNLSKNECKKKSQIKINTESYIVVVIENVNCESKINIASIINWTDDEGIISLDPETYLARCKIRGCTTAQSESDIISVDEENVSDNLYIGQLNESITEEDLIDALSQFGSIISCTKRWPNYGFIQFSSKEEARNALINKNGTEIKGRIIKVDFDHSKNDNNNYKSSISSIISTNQADKNKTRYELNNNKLDNLCYSGEQFQQLGEAEVSDTLHIGGLNEEITEDDLIHFFERFVNFDYCRKKPEWGYGFIKFYTKNDAYDVYEKSKREKLRIKGRLIKLNFKNNCKNDRFNKASRRSSIQSDSFPISNSYKQTQKQQIIQSQNNHPNNSKQSLQMSNQHKKLTFK